MLIVSRMRGVEGFQTRDCSSITDCGQCVITQGCTFCGSKCVNNDAASSQCGSDKLINDFQFCPNQTSQCSDISDCNTCTERLDCVYCVSSNKCVDAVKSNQLCPQESIVSVPSSCSLVSPVTDSSGNLYGNCSSASNCSQCMSTPDCYWCSNQNMCVSSSDVYNQCKNDKIIDSLSQCSGDTLQYNQDISGVTIPNNPFPSQVSESSVSSSQVPDFTNELQADNTTTEITSTETVVPTTNTLGPNNSIDFVSMKSSNFIYPNDSIIPVLGLSRSSNGLLTDSSIKIILDGIKARGYSLKDTQSKNKVLELIKKEKDFYSKQMKKNVSNYVNNSMDYISDGTSLSKAQNTEQHIKDLDIVSRYIENINTSSFVEAYQDLDTDRTKFLDNVQRSRATNSVIELLWFANLVALGFIFFV